MGLMAICLLLLVTLTSIFAERLHYSPQYDYSVEDFTSFRPYFEHDLTPVGSRHSRRISLNERTLENGRKNRFEPSDLEVLDDFEDENEDDDHSYTVGARIKVQHPPSSGHYKNKDTSQATSFTNFKISHDEKPPPPLKSHKNRSSKQQKPRNKKPIFKPAREFENEYSEEDLSTNSYGIDKDPRDFKSDFTLQKVPNLYPREYENVASKGQIAKYIEDQQKLIDEVIQLRLLNDPSPGSRAKYQQFLKAKEDERIEKEYEEDLKRRPLALFKPNIEPIRRLPRKNHQKRRTTIYPPSSLPPALRARNGLKNFVPHAMSFRLEV